MNFKKDPVLSLCNLTKWVVKKKKRNHTSEYELADTKVMK